MATMAIYGFNYGLLCPKTGFADDLGCICQPGTVTFSTGWFAQAHNVWLCVSTYECRLANENHSPTYIHWSHLQTSDHINYLYRIVLWRFWYIVEVLRHEWECTTGIATICTGQLEDMGVYLDRTTVHLRCKRFDRNGAGLNCYISKTDHSRLSDCLGMLYKYCRRWRTIQGLQKTKE